MALLYRIPFEDRWGKHVAGKWAESPEEALGFLKAQHNKPGRGEADYGTPVPADPQPFGFAETIPEGNQPELASSAHAEAGDLVLSAV